MTGWRLETTLGACALVAILFLAADGDPDVWTMIYATAAALVAAGLICAKWARIRADAGRMRSACLLATGAAFLLIPGATLVVLILAEPTPVDNGGHIL
jgi:hypothetical protein